MSKRFRKILLTGANGQVGYAMHNKLACLGEVITLNRDQLDLIDEHAIRLAVRAIKPDLIVNAAAYTAVDLAESEPDIAYAINGSAPGILAQEATKLGAWLLHYSTDYVFDGKLSSAYTENDVPRPLNQYGASKLAGELAIQQYSERYFIFRTSWVYGNHGGNFYKTILKLAQQKSQMKIVADQIGAPTHALAIAHASICILEQYTPEQNGLYHLSNAGKTSWYEFAAAIIEQYQLLQAERHWPVLTLQAEGLEAISASEYLSKTLRPCNSLLDNSRLAQQFGIVLPDWKDELRLAIDSFIPEQFN